MVFSSLAALRRVSAGSQAASQFAANVELDVRVAHEQRLRIRVHGDELHAPQSGLDHAVDCVDAAATDADDLQHGWVVLRCACHCLPFGQGETVFP